MTAEQRQAYEWAKNQTFQSVAARYAKTLAELVDELTTAPAAQQEAEKNEPLTLDELRQMDGEPVWVHFIDHPDYPQYGSKNHRFDGWRLISREREAEYTLTGAKVRSHKPINQYGKTWLAYRHKPKEAEHGKGST